MTTEEYNTWSEGVKEYYNIMSLPNTLRSTFGEEFPVET
jgi:hypothetical protein|tara:strand:+ start:264 stop:380 length:117 start_codon:yes stop_codon:yes gene_type:complete